MRAFPLIILLIICAPHAHAQPEPPTAATLGLRGPVRMVWERTVEYHGVFDLLSEQRGRVLSERRFGFDSEGRLLREESRDGEGRLIREITYRWQGDVVLRREHRHQRPEESISYTAIVRDSSGYLSLQVTYYDSVTSPLTIHRTERDGTERIYLLRDSVMLDSATGAWLPGVVEGQFYLRSVEPQTDASKWIYSWSCGMFDSTATIYRGDRYDERGRMVENFYHDPIFVSCWTPHGAFRFTYNDRDDLTSVTPAYSKRDGGHENDYLYDEHDNWVQGITSEIHYLWIIPVVIPVEKTVRVIEYDASGE